MTELSTTLDESSLDTFPLDTSRFDTAFPSEKGKALTLFFFIEPAPIFFFIALARCSVNALLKLRFPKPALS